VLGRDLERSREFSELTRIGAEPTALDLAHVASNHVGSPCKLEGGKEVLEAVHQSRTLSFLAVAVGSLEPFERREGAMDHEANAFERHWLTRRGAVEQRGRGA
jgi:hypothetical protein